MLARACVAHTERVPAEAASQPGTSPPGTWRPWTIGVPAALALVASLLLLVADGFAAVMAGWDTPQPGRGWITVAAIGHVVLAAGSIILLAAGLGRPLWRRPAAIMAWAIIPVGVGWFLLLGRLASGA
jgi:hypothetical protein